MEKIVLFVFLFALPLFAQRNDLGAFAVGNFNGGSFIYIQGDTPVDVAYRSSAGVGVEYRHWLTPSIAAGVWWMSNPSTGIQFTSSNNPYHYDFPLIRYEFAAPMTVRLWQHSRIKPFFQLGVGYIVTQSLQASSLAGWSHDPNLIGGGGFDYDLSSQWEARAAVLIWDGPQGCYDDPTCRASIGQTQDLRVGMAYKF